MGLFTPAGPIAAQEGQLIITAVLLMLVIVIPFFITFFIVARKYRAGNASAKYSPNKKHGVWAEIILWVLPAIIVAVLGVITWGATHALDPRKPIESNAQPLTIQVVALQWKWLFIYPQQGIATVNFIEFPVRMPLHFVLTADAPMSSFWIPQLGSQIYAMAGMTTQLNLMADKPGIFDGEDTEINGAGYSDMRFAAQAVSQSDFDAWVTSAKQSSLTLASTSYNQLAEPSQDNPTATYASVDPDLYNDIVMKPMMPMSETSTMQMSGMQM